MLLSSGLTLVSAGDLTIAGSVGAFDVTLVSLNGDVIVAAGGDVSAGAGGIQGTTDVKAYVAVATGTGGAPGSVPQMPVPGGGTQPGVAAQPNPTEATGDGGSGWAMAGTGGTGAGGSKGGDTGVASTRGGPSGNPGAQAAQSQTVGPLVSPSPGPVASAAGGA